MNDLNDYLQGRLTAAGINCPACEEPEPVNAGDGPYITWRLVSVHEEYASGEVWARDSTVALSLFSPMCERADCDSVTRALLTQLKDAFDYMEEDILCCISMEKIKGQHIADINRRVYDATILIREA